MIIVLVEVGVQESTGDNVRAVVKRMEQETRKEPGCITYAFSTDVSDPTTIRVTERWRSMDDLRRASRQQDPHPAQAIQPRKFQTQAGKQSV